MSINNDDFYFIKEKSKLKKDGIYSARGIDYAVKNNKLIFLAHYGDVHQCSFGFLVHLGKVENYLQKKKLKELLKNFKED